LLLSATSPATGSAVRAGSCGDGLTLRRVRTWSASG
jgi:hypothetical protein